ncbi:hypothetical protein Tco_1066282 [Tanacetum coccineum]|uniref:Uncharacterized protein n=1 Tax=Tanacetum coccineum TaxID=301880 RepID=A0ABQ5HA59_9ASTR
MVVHLHYWISLHLTIDLSNSGLKEFQQPEFEGYGFKANKSDESEVKDIKSDNVQQKPKQANQPRKVSKNPRYNRTNWNEKKTQKLGVGFQFTKKACFVCGSHNHLIKDCDFHIKKEGFRKKPVLNNVKRGTGQREVRLVWNNAMRVNHQNFSNSRRNFIPTAVLIKSGIVPVSTTRPINIVGNRVTSVVGEQGINVVKSSACWTATVETVNDGEQQITVTVDEQTIAITKASVRRHLQLANVDGISSLPNTEIFEQLTLIGSDEGSKKLNELTKLCTNYMTKSPALRKGLKQTKKVYGKALTKLVKKVKYLEDKLKSTLVRRKAMMVISDDEEDLVLEDPSKQGRMTETEYEDVDVETEYEEVEYELDQTDTFQQITPTKVSQGEEQSQESSEVQLDVPIQEESTVLEVFLVTAEEGIFKYCWIRIANKLIKNIVAEQVQERQSDTIKRYQTLKKKPVSVAQARKNMMIYLKNMAGYKMGYFKGMSYDEIRPIFQNVKGHLIASVQPIQEQPTEEPKELSEEELRKMLEIVSVEEIMAKALQVKNITEAYQVFEDMLKGFDREDLVTLWSLVKERFRLAEPTKDMERALWVELKRLFEPDKYDVLWKLQKYMHDPLTWRLFDAKQKAAGGDGRESLVRVEDLS